MNRILQTGVAGLALLAGSTLAASAQTCSSACNDSRTGAVVEASMKTSSGSADIIDTAMQAGNFKILAKAVQTAGLVDTLKGKGPFTVFAPTDEAFGHLPKGTVEELLKPEKRELLTSILTYHVASGRLTADKVVGADSAATVNGQRVNFDVDGGKVMVDDATVVKADIECSNGVIHVIDRVLMPSFLDVVDTAVQAGKFKTLATALTTAHLVETLKGKGPFTVFAPSDAAFAKLPDGTVESLLQKKSRDKLISVLTYHVVPGRITAQDAVAAGTATTVQGQELRFRLVDGQLFVNGARIVKTDIETTNGVIHVIDEVILPPSES